MRGGRAGDCRSRPRTRPKALHFACPSANASDLWVFEGLVDCCDVVLAASGCSNLGARQQRGLHRASHRVLPFFRTSDSKGFYKPPESCTEITALCLPLLMVLGNLLGGGL